MLEVPVLEEGQGALERIDAEMGLAFDDWDLDYYTTLFRDRIRRNPTNVECFDIAQSNSEHSRHWFFNGRLVIDGEEMPNHLMALIRAPLDANPNNSVIAFRDNSSAIRGYRIETVVPLQIEIEASDGASDYGNKFGEPVIQGYTRSFGMRLPSGERREWIKPIMFSGGIGQIDARHTHKDAPAKGMWVVKIGGPAYRIGMGGGAASSMVQGENVAELDFNAVQRGDAEMENRMNRVIRACAELGDGCPIVSIHDRYSRFGGQSHKSRMHCC